MKIRDGYIIKEVAGLHLAVCLEDDANIESAMIQLNETGLLLWEKLVEGAERDELIAHLLDVYDVSKEIAARDTDAFLELLTKAGVFKE